MVPIIFVGPPIQFGIHCTDDWQIIMNLLSITPQQPASADTFLRKTMAVRVESVIEF